MEKKFINIGVTHFTNSADIKKCNNYLDKCAREGKLRAIRQDKVAGGGENLTFANYKDNAMYTMVVNKKGFIDKIVKW